MTAEEYANTQQQILLMAELVSDLPLIDFLEAIEHADAVGPIFDPTLWISGERTMHRIQELAARLLAFQRAALKFKQSRPANA